MIINKKSLRNLEFNKVLKWISNYASSEITKKIILNLRPLNQIEQIQQRYEFIKQFINLVNLNGRCSFDGLINVAILLKKAKIKGSHLSPLEILLIANQCVIYQNIKRYIQLGKEHAPDLWKIINTVEDFSDFIKLIKRMISDRGEIHDIASEKLLKIRKEKKKIQETIINELELFMKRKENVDIIQEPLVLERDGRFVLLIKAEKKKEVNAIIHGTSSSGAAYYCELINTVELNNQLKILKEREKEACKEILQDYTDKIRALSASILVSQSKISMLEFIHTLAVFAIEQNACIAKLDCESGIELEEVYHPLLKYKANKLGKIFIVGLSIKIEPFFKGMIITGPNMGGKTVALKNIGLVFLMAHCGIPVLGKNATIPFISALYADIGEKQDLIQDLSTFSSHIRNIIPMLNSKEKNALYIIDELGTGTDPSEGAPLAVAILEALSKKEGLIIATTHHNAVKVYAENEDYFMNASMDFDTTTLKPTFKIVPGIVGTSHAFEIAYKLGMSSEIIESAKKMRNSKEEAYYNAIEKLNQQIRNFELVKENWMKEKIKIEEKLNNAIEESNRQKKILIEQHYRLKEDVNEFLRKGKNKIEEIIKEIKKSSSKDLIDHTKESLKELEKEAENVIKVGIIEDTADEKIEVNDYVKLKGTSLICRVTNLDSDGSAIVNYGNNLMQIPLGMLIKVKDREQIIDIEEKRVNKVIFLTEKDKGDNETGRNLNLIGLRLEEAIEELKRFIDKAVLNNINQIKIVHGYGKIKKGVIDYISKNLFVKRWREAELYEGGAGSTIVEIKGIDE